ncbi:hypothetical protein [Cumulibacter manganitolerans]|uniref:hypothetical protein n=1 Tax=Cumulibacter manganitolerans TaxID=1884992 RepID=UPI00129490AB|nr:hypothetical protein [Cumulibacter manganitolerans]
MIRLTRFAGAGVAGVLALSLAACTDQSDKPSTLSDEPSSSQATTSAAESSSAASSSEEQAVIAQYKGYYNAIYTLATPTEVEVRAAFDIYATKPVVDNWVEVFKSLAAAGKRPAGEIHFGPLEVVVKGAQATTKECRDSSSELVVSTTDGTTLTRGGPGTLIDGRLTKESGSWLVVKAVATESAC